MALLIAFNAVLILLALAVVRGWVPTKSVGSLVAGFHLVIGITPPTETQLRWVIVAWIVSLLLIVDLMLLLFVYVF